MFCNKCGGDVGPDNDFCTNCGAPVRRVEQEPMEPSPPLGPAPPTPPGPPVKSPASASLTSPLGIVAIVAVVLIVVAGIVVGVVVATRDGDEGHVSNETGTSETTGQQQADYEENDIKHAREVMNEFLMVYVSGGWCSGSMYMTSSCYEKFCGPDAMYPPPDQGDFDVVGAEVSDYEVIDDNTILFNILQRDRLDQTSPQQELCFADSPRRITTIPEIKPQHVVVSWGLKNDQQGNRTLQDFSVLTTETVVPREARKPSSGASSGL